MENRLPQKRATLFSLAESMASGCHEHEASIQLTHNREANVNADLDAARIAEQLFQAARTAKLDAVKNHNAADKSAHVFLVTARDVLKPHLGTSWSQRWVPAGFLNNSLAIPKAQVDRSGLMACLKGYFTEYPAHEVDKLAATAAAAEGHHAALLASRGARNECRTDLGQKKSARTTAMKKLRKRMRGLIAELKQILPPDDPRWIAFGLNRPAAQPVPSAPKELKWKAPRADICSPHGKLRLTPNVFTFSNK